MTIQNRKMQGSSRARAQLTTANATPAPFVFPDGLLIPADTTWMFEIDIVARRTDANDESAAYRLLGCIDRNVLASTTALVGSVGKTVVAEDTSAWDVAATADATNGAITVTVTGEASKTILWTARVRLVEASG